MKLIDAEKLLQALDKLDAPAHVSNNLALRIHRETVRDVKELVLTMRPAAVICKDCVYFQTELCPGEGGRGGFCSSGRAAPETPEDGGVR